MSVNPQKGAGPSHGTPPKPEPAASSPSNRKKLPAHLQRMGGDCGPSKEGSFLLRWGFGMRTLKTALAVFICLGIDLLLGYGTPQNACIAAILTMQATERDSFYEGGRRLLGTAIGGAIGIAMLGLSTLWPHPALQLIFTTFGVMLAISLCCLIRNQQAAAFTAIVVVGLALQANAKDTFALALWQLVETAVGVVVAVLVNHFIARPGTQRHRSAKKRRG